MYFIFPLPEAATYEFRQLASLHVRARIFRQLDWFLRGGPTARADTLADSDPAAGLVRPGEG